MAVTPGSRTASAHSSPTKSNGRRPTKIAIDLSDEDEVEEKRPARGKGRASAAKEEIEVSSDDDDDVVAEEEYEVEAIRRHRRAKGHESWKYEYLIKWKNWSEDDNTWEPEEHLPSELVDKYWKSQPSKSQPKKFQQKRKALSDEEDEDEEEIEDSDEDEDDVRRKPNGRRASSSTSRKSASSRNSGAKKARTSTSGRRRAKSEDEEDESEEEEEDSDDADKKEVIAINKIRDYFRDYYLKRDDWDDIVESIINMTREADSQLKSYVQFKQDPNWIKAMAKAGLPNKYAKRGPQIWVANEVVNERCPHKVIKFYEGHIRFSNPRPAH